MFGLVSSKRVKELEDKISSLESALKIRIGEDTRKIITKSTILPFCGYVEYQEMPYDKRPEIKQSEAILAIAAHLGLEFKVEPARGEAVKLVKVKK